MKRALFSLFLIVLFLLPSLACGTFVTDTVMGSGDIVNQIFDVTGFERVTLEGSGKVLVEQGQTERLSVQIDDNLVSLLDIRVRGNELILGVRAGFDLHPSQDITYNVTVKNLHSLKLAGSGAFEVGPLEASELKVSLPGSGDITVESVTSDELVIDLDGSGNISLEDIHVKTIDTSLQGSGDIELEGQTQEETVVVRGSGNYRAGNLESEAADISIPGSADVIVWVTEDLQVSVNGTGNIQYYGEAALDQAGFGSGTITPLGEK
jgi:hypothetical protein